MVPNQRQLFIIVSDWGSYLSSHFPFVLWSDESKFEVFGSNRCVLVRRRLGERMISACVVLTVKRLGALQVTLSVLYL